MTLTPEQHGAPPETPPVCYRHPGRETWVRCSRCERPICPDCMHAAAVGYQCPDCVTAGRRSTAPARTMAGGRLVARPGQVTLLLIAVNVAVFLLEQARPSVVTSYDTYPAAVAAGQWYRLFTGAFLHENWLHIAMNMWALYVVGPPLEAALGRARFVVLYLVSLFGGAVLFYLLVPAFSAAVGASGAIFGLFGGLAVLSRRLRANVQGIGLVIGVNLIFSFTISGIAWQDHIGGLVCGALLTAAYAYAPRSWRTPAAVAAPAALAVVFAVAVALRTAALGG